MGFRLSLIMRIAGIHIVLLLSGAAAGGNALRAQPPPATAPDGTPKASPYSSPYTAQPPPAAPAPAPAPAPGRNDSTVQQPPAAPAPAPAGTPQAAPYNSPYTVQQPAPGGNDSTTTATPLTPLQERERQIRQFDPLDRGDKDNQDGKDKDTAAQEDRRRRSGQAAPTPGSIAATERDSAAGKGPQVVSGGDANAPVQDYSGPAVLSRSYSVSRPLVPQELRWTESLGANAVYDTGVIDMVNANGSLSPSALTGVELNWGISGRHYFRHDQIAVDYSGSLDRYAGAGGYNGANNSATVDYTHVISRRLSLNLAGTGQILSQSYVVGDLGPAAGTTIAGINLGTSPNIQITDTGLNQLSFQADAVWQKSARLSFDLGSTWFGVTRSGLGMMGMTGEQERADADYRLTRRTTVGAYYSFNHYLFPHGAGNSDTNTIGLIYSYAFSSSMEFRFRGGMSGVESLGLTPVGIAPAVAALLGQSSGIIDAYASIWTTDVSAQFIKDFRRGKTATVAYAHGVSPGNGIFQTSVQESIGASATVPFLRRYTVTAGFGRDALTAIGQTLGNYTSDYGRLSFSRKFNEGMETIVSGEFRHFDIAQTYIVRNQLRLTAGFSWSPASGRLWPF